MRRQVRAQVVTRPTSASSKEASNVAATILAADPGPFAVTWALLAESSSVQEPAVRHPRGERCHGNSLVAVGRLGGNGLVSSSTCEHDYKQYYGHCSSVTSHGENG